MKNQIINKENLAEAMKNTEIDLLLADMELVNKLANYESAHGPVDNEIKDSITSDIKQGLSVLMDESDDLKAIFIIAVNGNNEYRTIYSGELPALSRIVLLTGVESMRMAQSLANDIRECETEAEEQD